MYRDVSDASFSGVEAIYEAVVDYNYPGEECTADDYRESWGLPEGTQLEYIVLPETIEPDPDWTIPGGPLDGVVPDGRTYVFQVIVTDRFPGQEPIESRSEVHASVIDGKAYFFMACF